MVWFQAWVTPPCRQIEPPTGKTSTHVTFQCFDATGAPCPGNNILVYHCFGIGAP